MEHFEYQFQANVISVIIIRLFVRVYYSHPRVILIGVIK